MLEKRGTSDRFSYDRLIIQTFSIVRYFYLVHLVVVVVIRYGVAYIERAHVVVHTPIAHNTLSIWFLPSRANLPCHHRRHHRDRRLPILPNHPFVPSTYTKRNNIVSGRLATNSRSINQYALTARSPFWPCPGLPCHPCLAYHPCRAYHRRPCPCHPAGRSCQSLPPPRPHRRTGPNQS